MHRALKCARRGSHDSEKQNRKKWELVKGRLRWGRVGVVMLNIAVRNDHDQSRSCYPGPVQRQPRELKYIYLRLLFEPLRYPDCAILDDLMTTRFWDKFGNFTRMTLDIGPGTICATSLPFSSSSRCCHKILGVARALMSLSRSL